MSFAVYEPALFLDGLLCVAGLVAIALGRRGRRSASLNRAPHGFWRDVFFAAGVGWLVWGGSIFLFFAAFYVEMVVSARLGVVLFVLSGIALLGGSAVWIRVQMLVWGSRRRRLTQPEPPHGA
jgi:hypothetical protein